MKKKSPKFRPLSISSYSRFMENPAKYNLHYNKRIRPIYKMSYFVFGGCVDKGINAALGLHKEIEPYNITEEALKKSLLDGKTEFITNDYDGELISDKRKEEMLKELKKYGYKGDDVDVLAKSLLKKPFTELSENQRYALGLCCYESLRVKAFLMLDAFQNKIAPKLKNAEDIQKELIWTDDDENTFTGFIDFRTEFMGKQYLADNKTSSNTERDYPDGCVENSIQLGAYAGQTGDTDAVYFIFDKRIKKNRIRICVSCETQAKNPRVRTCDKELDGKRCGGEFEHSIKPECEVVYKTGKISREEKNFIQKTLTEAANLIKAGIFPHNYDNCKPKMYGDKEVKCPYYNYCRTGDMTGLEMVPETKKKDEVE